MFKENIKLNELARLFTPYADLYAVGGYVRDNILGYSGGDLDICSKLMVIDVKKILLNTDFVVIDKNFRVGTVMIKSGNFSAEYTTFRIDSYRDCGGGHTPCDVEFTHDMRLDALRRDFKMNAIYFNPISGECIDLLGGMDDIKNRIISTTDKPEKVFAEDGLRLLRLARFYAEFNFEIETATLEAARANAFRIRDIAPERITEELKKIFVADTAHAHTINIGGAHMDTENVGNENALEIDGARRDTENACTNSENPDGAYMAAHTDNAMGHVRGITLLDELGLLEILLPELTALKGLEQNKKYHLYDAYRHSIEAFRVAPCKIRWAALLHDVGKKIAILDHDNMHGHEICGAEAVRARLNVMKFPSSEIRYICKLIENHMMDLTGNMSENKLRWFIAENADTIDGLCDLRDADCIASCGEKGQNRLRDTYFAMLDEGAPLCIKQLKADGKDLVNLGVADVDRGALLAKLWHDTVMNNDLNNRESALKYLKKAVEKL